MIQEFSGETIIKASQGDINAFEQIYRATSNYVYNTALKITNNREEAEEVTQDVFLKIYNNLKYFQFRSNIKTWIYRITVNTAINYARRSWSQLARSVEYEEDILYRPTTEVLAQRLGKEEKQSLARRMLAFLNPEQRACVVLRDMQGLSYKQIAQTLRININTVRSRLRRARQALLRAVQKGVI
jgi:RNA polymerase sigma-70 factor (ECF subfamily)